MTPQVFDLLAALLKSREPVISGARLVILGGMKNAEAARQVGATPQTIHRSVQRFLALHQKISAVYGSHRSTKTQRPRINPSNKKNTHVQS